jgi:hypothetical protein
MTCCSRRGSASGSHIDLKAGVGEPKRPTFIRPKRAFRFLREQVGDPNALSLHNLADIAGLPPSRFLHVLTGGRLEWSGLLSLPESYLRK